MTDDEITKERSKLKDNADQFLSGIKTVKGDKEIANDLRKKFFDALAPVAELIAEAESNGFEVGFQFGKNAFGQAQIQVINLLKKY